METKPITIEDLYNQVTILTKNVSLDKNNNFILNEELKDNGWNIGMGFQEKSSLKIVQDEINRLKSLKYEVAIAILEDQINCLLYKDTLKK